MLADPAARHEDGVAWNAALVVLLTAALGLVAFYDLRLALPFNDEWFYRWSITELAAGHGVRLWPGALPPNLLQIAAGSLPVALRLPVETSRLTVLPFLLAQAAFAWWCGRQLGTDRFWAGVAALAVALSPLELAVATGVMSDVAYLALLAAAAAFGLRWVTAGKGRWACVVLAAVAALQRQHAVGIPLAMTVALYSAGRLRDRGEMRALAALWLSTLAALALPLVTGIATPAVRGVAAAEPPVHLLTGAIGVLTLSAPMLGLLAIPLAVAAWALPGGETGSRSRWVLLPVALAEAGLLAAFVFGALDGNMIFPGDYFGNWGLGALHMAGTKPAVWPLPGFVALEAAAVATFAIVLIRRRRLWTPSRLGAGGILLTILALTQLLPMVSTGATDRYHLAVAVPLLPVIAAAVSGTSARPRVARVWALAAIAGGLALYAVAEADFESWQEARDALARQQYALAAAGHLGAAAVEAGYEEDGTHYLLPAYLATGSAPAYRPDGLPGARVHLRFSIPTDPRPGRSYSSAAPGRIIVEGSLQASP